MVPASVREFASDSAKSVAAHDVEDHGGEAEASDEDRGFVRLISASEYHDDGRWEKDAPELQLRVPEAFGEKTEEVEEEQEAKRFPPPVRTAQELLTSGLHGDGDLDLLVPVDDLRYSQDSCGGCFSDGRPLEDLIQELDKGVVDHQTADFMRLDVIRREAWDGSEPLLFSIHNRRLFCLKEHQRHKRQLHRAEQVLARVRVTRDPDALCLFALHHTTTCSGKDIEVRDGGCHTDAVPASVHNSGAARTREARDMSDDALALEIRRICVRARNGAAAPTTAGSSRPSPGDRNASGRLTGRRSAASRRLFSPGDRSLCACRASL